MANQSDFGFREGRAQLGCYHKPAGGLAFIYATRGQRETASAGTLWAWILSDGPYTQIRMIIAYEPSAVNAYPVRAAVRGGDVCSFPSIEADTLVAAGVATYA